uniref:Uncharacterized protein n=1 Tax=Rhizophora mucronata TaxID=61149 RepID=A0A2P2Q0E6_RHIMU
MNMWGRGVMVVSAQKFSVLKNRN